ncbi:MAG: mechanosensitive ion channel family protein [Deltaproteobacteria bacterium]
MTQFFKDWQPWLVSAAILIGAVVVARIVHAIIFAAGRRIARRSGNTLDDSVVNHSNRPVRAILPLLALSLALPVTYLPPNWENPIRQLVVLGMIASVAWLLVSFINVFEDVISQRYRVDVADNLRARKLQTQVQVLRRIGVVVISIIALSIMLMTFPSIRQFGVSLFASAGLAGLVVAMAARPTLASLIAGVQIALTEPIRLEDVVIVEGEWGWIEEISTTYVVVRIWDLRRLVVPLSYFLDHPFQNWTRKTAEILGTVFVYTDYTVPVDDVRQELHRILKTSDLWDGKVWGVQVTNATDRSMELRALMSSVDSGKAWDLRCYVREKLIGFLQEKYPQSLPRMRAELNRLPAGA